MHKYITLPLGNFSSYLIFKKSTYSIGHDPIHDQYKVVFMLSTRKDGRPVHKLLAKHWVFILGGGVSSRWRKISNSCPQHSPFTRGLTINGRMYYLALVPSMKFVLVRFNISSEETRLLKTPEEVTWLYQFFSGCCYRIQWKNSCFWPC